ncbi:MAG TPA: AAA family ATPase [Pyrinomonadaceae bacterium]|nr:AAA family ATPase [Pyrinomonadaceae bacterium]
MHMHRLKVSAFRNLKDFEITFTETADDANAEDGHRTFDSHAVIGANGTGKSNLIEAIITIFRDLDLNQPASLDYEMDYSIRDHRVEIKGQSGKRPMVLVDGGRAAAARLSDDAREFLPSNVFVYYSGKNERIERLFLAHQRRFIQRMEISAEEYLPERILTDLTGEEQAQAIAENRRRADRRRERLGEDQLRRLFYCRGGHSQLVLLACLLSKDEWFVQLLKNLNIVELDSALFVLKQPYGLRQDLTKEDILQGDKRFWYARGDVVSEFLDKLWQLAVAPIKDTVSKLIDFRGRTERQDQIYLFLPSKERLQELGALIGDAARFFRYAEAAYIGDLIEEVRIYVKHKDAEGNISFNQLSEGELQLLTVLGLMRITSQDHCLFLLDEPDTHLNPIWKLRYFDEIEKVIRKNETQTIAGDSQIIITTHDPMMIGGLRREQVRILRLEHGKSIINTPEEHPQGMGVAGLLKSEMFGLASTLDEPTLRDLDERNELLAKRSKEQLTEPEEERLKRLTDHLDDLGFSRENRDPLYQLFIQKMYEVRSQPLTSVLSAEEIQTQAQLAETIVTALIKEERNDELSTLAQEVRAQMER